jgi:hypothetical protein
MTTRVWAFAVLLGWVALGGAACGGGPSAKFSIAAKGGPMPAGQSWEGVYYNPVYGYLHVVGEGGNLTGRWRRTNSSGWGELSGSADGNVLNFTWTEHKYGEVGPAADVKGTGVFVFKLGPNDIPELDGQFAINDSDSVGDWHCIKQMNQKPDINSVNGDNPMGAPAPDQWK